VPQAESNQALQEWNIKNMQVQRKNELVRGITVVTNEWKGRTKIHTNSILKK